MSIEHQLLCIIQLALTAGVLLFALFGFSAVRWLAKWVGSTIATIIWGEGRPR